MNAKKREKHGCQSLPARMNAKKREKHDDRVVKTCSRG